MFVAHDAVQEWRHLQQNTTSCMCQHGRPPATAEAILGPANLSFVLRGRKVTSRKSHCAPCFAKLRPQAVPLIVSHDPSKVEGKQLHLWEHLGTWKIGLSSRGFFAQKCASLYLRFGRGSLEPILQKVADAE